MKLDTGQSDVLNRLQNGIRGSIDEDTDEFREVQFRLSGCGVAKHASDVRSLFGWYESFGIRKAVEANRTDFRLHGSKGVFATSNSTDLNPHFRPPATGIATIDQND
jgi:hypothetical protein